MEREILEIKIANDIATRIAEGVKMGLEYKSVMEMQFAAIGASIAILYPQATSSNTYKLAGGHARAGFLEANALELDPDRAWKP